MALAPVEAGKRLYLIIVDGRNLLEADDRRTAGFIYHGIGKMTREG